MTLLDMFGEAEREALRTRLTGLAQDDQQIVAAALLGSAARGELDRWSDIDLALRLGPGVELDEVVGTWTARVAQIEPVVDHLDIRASGALYRVLLLASSLQVDLSFWPHNQPIAGGAPVAVLFGEMPVALVGNAGGLERSQQAVRMGWLYALHVRSALGRGRRWQALRMLQSIRDVVVDLYCQRLGLPVGEGRGVDRLPAVLLDGVAQTYPSKVEPEQLSTSFHGLTGLLLEEAELHDVQMSADLTSVIVELARQEHEPTASSSTMRAVFDANAVDPLVDEPGAMDLVLQAVASHSLEVFFSHVTLGELADAPDAGRRRALLLALVSVGQIIPTGAAVYGTSRFGHARFGDESAGLDHLRSGAERHTVDALVAATASLENATLITSDGRLTRRAREAGIEVRSMPQLLDWISPTTSI